MNSKPVLEVKNLSVQLHSGQGIIQPIDRVSFSINAGEIFALVGESGCGKSMTALAINRLLPDSAWYCEGSEVTLENKPLHQLSENAIRDFRRQNIGMIFQDPNMALNPVMNVQEQLYEAMQSDAAKMTRSQLKARMIELLESVRIPSPEALLEYYPHQLSGGLKQRIMIAMAIANSPKLLIADEPTTALDVTTQAQVLNLLKDLNKRMQMSILLISHDLGIVAQMADHVAVMYAGHLIETASRADFFKAPQHPYSQKLFGSLPENATNNQLAVIPGQVPSLNQAFKLCRFKPRCPYLFKPCEETKPELYAVNSEHKARCHWHNPEVLKEMRAEFRLENIKAQKAIPTPIQVVEYEDFAEKVLAVNDLKVYYPIQKGLFKRTVGYVKAVDGVQLDLFEGETLAIVGESGCGKTTLAKALMKLVPAHAGDIQFMSENLLALRGRNLRRVRGELQMIFQDPFSSMDPRMRVQDIIEEGMRALKVGSDAAERQDRVDVLLEQVGLAGNFKLRYPHELSGGQRQRVAIARALAVGARLIVCDEPTSALDVSVQAQILNLLKQLQEDLGISYIFITHNISVVHYLANTVAVMYLGRIVEYGSKEAIFSDPKHPYTQALFASVPSLDHQHDFFKPPKGEIPSIVNPPQGCHFSPRCPFVHERCYQAYPASYQVGKEHRASCYLYSEEERGSLAASTATSKGTLL